MTLAYAIEKSKIGTLGFDQLNFFTNDKIYFTGFNPTEDEILKIGEFIKFVNRFYFSQIPVMVCFNKRGEGDFVADVKILCSSDPIYASSEGSSADLVVANLKKAVLIELYDNDDASSLEGGIEFSEITVH